MKIINPQFLKKNLEPRTSLVTPVSWLLLKSFSTVTLFKNKVHFIDYSSATISNNLTFTTLLLYLHHQYVLPFESFTRLTLAHSTPKQWRNWIGVLTLFFKNVELPTNVIMFSLLINGKCVSTGDSRKSKHKFSKITKYTPNHPRNGSLVRYHYNSHFFFLKNFSGVTFVGLYSKHIH